MLYTFVAAIPQHKNQTDNWQIQLRHHLATSQFSLAAEDRLLHADELIGFCRCIELEEGNTLFHSAPWFALTQKCPWFQGLAGFFNWTHVANQTLAEEQLLPKLIQIGSTVIARTDNQHFKQPVQLVEYSLLNLLHRHGFNDGNAFLSRDEDYLMCVYDEIVRCMETASLEGHIALLQTAHNPLQLSEDLRRDGKPVSNETLALAELSVQIWAYDWDVLKDWEFWQD